MASESSRRFGSGRGARTHDPLIDGQHQEAIRRLLVELETGQDVFELSAAVADLHRKNNPFPGEVVAELAERHGVAR